MEEGRHGGELEQIRHSYWLVGTGCSLIACHWRGSDITPTSDPQPVIATVEHSRKCYVRSYYRSPPLDTRYIDVA
jgi:hypothetical protein